MSLFEKINKKILVEQSSGGSGGNDLSGLSDKEKKNINRNRKVYRDLSKNKDSGISKLNIDKKLNRDISQRITSQDRQQQLYNRQYDAYDDGDLGNPDQSKTQTSTKNTEPKNKFKTRTDKALTKRDEFIKARKAYTDSKTGIGPGKPTKKGIIDYISKARNKSQGTNVNTKANRKAAEIIAKSSGSDYADKITKKYETDKKMISSKKPYKKTLDAIKNIGKKNPTITSPVTGGKLPATKVNVRKYGAPNITFSPKRGEVVKSRTIVKNVTGPETKSIDDFIKSENPFDVKQNRGPNNDEYKKLENRKNKIFRDYDLRDNSDEGNPNNNQNYKNQNRTNTNTKNTTRTNTKPPKIEQKPVKQFDGKSFNDFIKDTKDKNKKLANQKLKIPNPIKTTPPKIETPLRKPFDPINPTKIKTKPSLFKKLKPFAKGATKVLKRNKWLAIALGVGALTQAYRQALKPRTKTTTTTTNNNSNKNLIAPMKTTDTFKPVDARIRLGPGKDILLPPTK